MESIQITVIILIAIGVLAIITFLAWRYLSLAKARGTSSIDPIDLSAFARLMDESDEDFIRNQLGKEDYKVARRKRIVAALDYLTRTHRNATIMLRIGEQAIRSADLDIKEDAHHLAQLSMRIRQQTTIALIRLRVALLFPSINLDSRPVIEAYAELRRVAEGVRRLQPSLFVGNS